MSSIKKRKINIPPLPAVLGSIVSVQAGATIAKGLFPILGAAGTTLLRIGLSALILLILNRPKLHKFTMQQWKAVIPYGICLGLMNNIFYMALARIPLGLAVTLEFIGPFALALIGAKKPVEFLWAALAAAGIALIAPWSENKIDLLGAALALLAGVLWAGYIFLGRRTSKVLDGGSAVTVGMIFAVIVVLPFSFTGGDFKGFTPAVILPGIGLALLSSAIPFTLEINALKHMPTKTFSILMSLEPAVAAMCGLIFLREHLSLKEWIAVVLVVAASTGATLFKKNESIGAEVPIT